MIGRHDPTPWRLLANVSIAETDFDRLQGHESRQRALALMKDAWADLDAWYDHDDEKRGATRNG